MRARGLTPASELAPDDGATGATTEEARQTEDDPAVTGDAATDATAAPDTQEESAGEDSGAETGSGSD